MVTQGQSYVNLALLAVFKMYLMWQQEEPDDSAIAAGESCALEELVQMAFVAAGLDRREHLVTDVGL